MLARFKQKHWIPEHFNQRPILEVALSLGLSPEEASGPWYEMCCPIHDDRNPSLRINIEGNYWTCFGCNFGGDALELIYRVRHARDPGYTRYDAYREVVVATRPSDDLRRTLQNGPAAPPEDNGIALAARLRAMRNSPKHHNRR